MRSLLISLLILLPPALPGQDAGDGTPDVAEIVKKMDELYRSDSSYAEMEMEIATPHWERKLEMKAWSQGMDKTFIRILAPKKEKGVGTLRIGTEMWNYLPKTNKIIKIPPSMMMGSWMGSDFTNDDLVREYTFLDDYTFGLLAPCEGEEELHRVEARPKEGLPIIWDRVVLAVRKDDYIPVRVDYYDEKGKLMRVLNYTDIKEFGERIIPSVIELVPQNKEGQKTVVRYKRIEFDIPVGEEIFSLKHLRARN